MPILVSEGTLKRVISSGVVRVHFVKGEISDRMLFDLLERFATILDKMPRANSAGQMASAHILCRMSRLIRLQLRGAPMVRGELLVSWKGAERSLELFRSARALIVKINKGRNNSDLAEYAKNIGSRLSAIRQMINKKEIVIREFCAKNRERASASRYEKFVANPTAR